MPLPRKKVKWKKSGTPNRQLLDFSSTNHIFIMILLSKVLVVEDEAALVLLILIPITFHELKWGKWKLYWISSFLGRLSLHSWPEPNLDKTRKWKVNPINKDPLIHQVNQRIKKLKDPPLTLHLYEKLIDSSNLCSVRQTWNYNRCGNRTCLLDFVPTVKTLSGA